MRYLTYFLLITFLLSACQSISTNHLTTEILDKTSLSFTGRGSSAAFMLDDLLGGGGMAVGIAIDQGIAKDIQKNLNQNPDFSVQDLVKKQWKNILNHSSIKKSIPSNKIRAVQITILIYGFKAAPGESDKVVPWLKLRIKNASQEKDYEYPIADSKPQSIGFDEAKNDPLKTKDNLEQAVGELLQVYFKSP